MNPLTCDPFLRKTPDRLRFKNNSNHGILDSTVISEEYLIRAPLQSTIYLKTTFGPSCTKGDRWRWNTNKGDGSL